MVLGRCRRSGPTTDSNSQVPSEAHAQPKCHFGTLANSEMVNAPAGRFLWFRAPDHERGPIRPEILVGRSFRNANQIDVVGRQISLGSRPAPSEESPDLSPSTFDL